MLPDIPDIKHDLFECQKDFMRQTARQEMGVFSDCRSYPCFEGDQMGIERGDGDKEKNAFNVTSGEETFAPQDENVDSNFAKLHSMGKQMAEMFQRQAFQYLDKSLADAGQTVKGKGRMTADTLMEVLEKIQIPLGDDGKLDLAGMRFAGGQAACDDLTKAMQEIFTDKEKTKKLIELEKRKEAEARARETDRKLAG